MHICLLMKSPELVLPSILQIPNVSLKPFERKVSGWPAFSRPTLTGIIRAATKKYGAGIPACGCTGRPSIASLGLQTRSRRGTCSAFPRAASPRTPPSCCRCGRRRATPRVTCSTSSAPTAPAAPPSPWRSSRATPSSGGARASSSRGPPRRWRRTSPASRGCPSRSRYSADTSTPSTTTGSRRGSSLTTPRCRSGWRPACSCGGSASPPCRPRWRRR
mmetsp:Transcript_70289/g.187281  ORF Transcript_70289/g.187281 Transcript_70289/m.187281 type:complete len:218 (+) Transcript_70289:199-852(+)